MATPNTQPKLSNKQTKIKSAFAEEQKKEQSIKDQLIEDSPGSEGVEVVESVEVNEVIEESNNKTKDTQQATKPLLPPWLFVFQNTAVCPRCPSGPGSEHPVLSCRKYGAKLPQINPVKRDTKEKDTKEIKLYCVNYGGCTAECQDSDVKETKVHLGKFSVCKFNSRCTMKDTCAREHFGVLKRFDKPCEKKAACPFKTCCYNHMCRFNLKCERRETCEFRHSDTNTTSNSNSNSTSNNNKRPCRFGDRCTTVNCGYGHPKDAVNSNEDVAE